MPPQPPTTVVPGNKWHKPLRLCVHISKTRIQGEVEASCCIDHVRVEEDFKRYGATGWTTKDKPGDDRAVYGVHARKL